VSPRPHLDERDRKILGLLGDNARQPATDMADQIGLSPAALRRRIARLEELDVIAKYTVVLNHERLDPSVQAYVELTFDGTADVQEVLAQLVRRSEVREASTLAGSPDALVRVRVGDNDRLRELVTEIRAVPGITSTKALVALGRLRHVSQPSA
jgi:Lrp/AsnC family transcriptional regulator, leucine-responsive regulatory protein